ncbi:hypothetical protein AQUCO_00400606v1 [Aquilegia coerulea]|uniref:Uncharacterized protein n=1 Tax=Aquilegia coerulea TaxID=218851 RepID=A0A2G5EVV1_AQUCA|nr:hypothetical protein AQUCO_00400606v1 [Aquilegia coerulea]
MSSSRFSDSASLMSVKGSPGGGKVLMELDKDVYGQNPVTKSETNLYWDNSYRKCNAIPTFLVQFLDTEDRNKLSTEEDIDCLFEVLTEVHGPDIVLQVNYIMESIIKTLTSSFVQDPVQHACAKLVYGIATYGIRSFIAEDKKKEIIYSLCKPLSDCLLGFQEGLVYGSALCLEALIDSANWRFASDEIVNDICLKVAVALEEKPTQTSAHMDLTMALTMHNSWIVEPYAISLIRSALPILSPGVEEEDSQKQLSAIQMVNVLMMKCVDPRSAFWKQQASRTKRPSSNQLKWRLEGERDGSQNFEVSSDKNSEIWEQDIDTKFVSSSSDVAANVDLNVSHSEDNAVIEGQCMKIKAFFKVGLNVFFGLSVILLGVILSFMWIDYQESGLNCSFT